MSDFARQLADALVTALQAGTFTTPVTVARKWDPIQQLSDAALKSPVVWIVPKDISDSRQAANFPPSRQRDVTIYLIFQQKVDPTDDSAIDALADLAEAVHDEAISEAREGASWQTSSCDGHKFADLHNENLFRREYAMTWRVFV